MGDCLLLGHRLHPWRSLRCPELAGRGGGGTRNAQGGHLMVNVEFGLGLSARMHAESLSVNPVPALLILSLLALEGGDAQYHWAWWTEHPCSWRIYATGDAV